MITYYALLQDGEERDLRARTVEQAISEVERLGDSIPDRGVDIFETGTDILVAGMVEVEA